MDRNLTILVAEDTEDDALFLERGFRKAGLKNPLQILTDGEEVIKYLKAQGKYEDRAKYPFPSVFFTDIKMPKMSGFEVLKWLRDHPECRVIPTIVISSSEEPEDVTRAYQIGCNAYLTKPRTLGELEDIIHLAYNFWARCAKPPVPLKCI